MYAVISKVEGVRAQNVFIKFFNKFNSNDSIKQFCITVKTIFSLK